MQPALLLVSSRHGVGRGRPLRISRNSRAAMANLRELQTKAGANAVAARVQVNPGRRYAREVSSNYLQSGYLPVENPCRDVSHRFALTRQSCPLRRFEYP